MSNRMYIVIKQMTKTLFLQYNSSANLSLYIIFDFHQFLLDTKFVAIVTASFILSVSCDCP